MRYRRLGPARTGLARLWRPIFPANPPGWQPCILPGTPTGRTGFESVTSSLAKKRRAPTAPCAVLNRLTGPEVLRES